MPEPNVILVKNADGFAQEIYPCTSSIPLADIARKVVPAGDPFLLIHTSDLPGDRTYQEAWEADFTNPDGYGEAERPFRLEDEDASSNG